MNVKELNEYLLQMKADGLDQLEIARRIYNKAILTACLSLDSENFNENMQLLLCVSYE